MPALPSPLLDLRGTPARFLHWWSRWSLAGLLALLPALAACGGGTPPPPPPTEGSATIDAGETWLPEGTKFSMVAANVMLISLLPIGVFAQWAVYSAKRDDKPHTGLALLLTGLIGLAFINAQAFIYATTELPVSQGTYSYLFYAVTGVSMLLAVVGVAFSATTAFRYLGGRTSDRAIVSAHALYWYAYSAVFAVVWFVVYVTK